MKLRNIIPTRAILFLLLLSAGMAKAQTYDSIDNYNVGNYNIELRNMMQLRDGNILANCQLFLVDEQGEILGDYGNKLIKISKHCEIMDQVFIPDRDLNFFLMERNPFGDDNVFAKLVRDLQNCRTDLHISFFDDDLNFFPEKEVWIPISDTVFPSLCDVYFLDNQGDIVFFFPITSRKERHFYRVGLDGTIKYHTVLGLDDIPLSFLPGWGRYFSTFNESPPEYCLWVIPNVNPTNKLDGYVFDTLLNLKERQTLHSPPGNIEFSYGWLPCVLGLDDSTFVVLSDFTKYLYDEITTGARLTRYDRNSLARLKTSYFTEDANGQPGDPVPIRVVKSGDGNLYLAYGTKDPFSRAARVCVMKLDMDFNVIWQRFCLDPWTHFGANMIALEDGGLAVGGLNIGAPPELFFIVFNDKGWGVSEDVTTVRPYAYWPNPAKDELHLHYSPDVKPTQIELYDLQGRLVRSQRNALESLNLQGLAQGTYTMRVALEDGTVFTDQVVKE